MEDDTENLSNILRGVQLPTGAYDYNMYQQNAGSSLEQCPETSFTSTDPSTATNPGLQVSLDANRHLPETLCSVQSTQQTPTTSHGSWDFQSPRSNEPNLNFSQERVARATGVYQCDGNEVSSQINLPNWTSSFQESPSLGQYDPRFENLPECSPAYDPVTSTPLGASSDSQCFNFNSQASPAVMSKSSPFTIPASIPGNTTYPSPSPVHSMELARSAENASTATETPSNSDPKDESDEDSGEGPYAMLIYKALMRAPGHRMHLQDIYAWFEKHTRKAKATDTKKGWRNSIRHNLSMNAAFQGTRKSDANSGSSKKNNVWALTEEAIKNGVQSTTRYRKQGKKTPKSENPAPQRQRSGAKGGRAARQSARNRRAAQFLTKSEPDLPTTNSLSYPTQGEPIAESAAEPVAHYKTTTAEYPQPISLATPRLGLPTLSEYDFNRIVECTDMAADVPIFYHDSETTQHGPSPDFPVLTNQDYWAKL